MGWRRNRNIDAERPRPGKRRRRKPLFRFRRGHLGVSKSADQISSGYVHLDGESYFRLVTPDWIWLRRIDPPTDGDA